MLKESKKLKRSKSIKGVKNVDLGVRSLSTRNLGARSRVRKGIKSLRA
jgi:hypothetical protein